MPTWRIETIPELRHLTPRERDKVLRPAFERFVRVKLTVPPIASGIGPSASGVVLIYTGLYSVVGVVLVLFAAFAALYIYLHMISRCREGLRRYLGELEAQGVSITCLQCGYDLRGSDTGICPEYGREPAKQE